MMKRILITLFLLFTLAACEQYPAQERTNTIFKGEYEFVEIEGMPCLVWQRGAYVSGITCDWTRWEGRE